jgi:type II secretory pathway component PulM
MRSCRPMSDHPAPPRTTADLVCAITLGVTLLAAVLYYALVWSPSLDRMEAIEPFALLLLRAHFVSFLTAFAAVLSAFALAVGLAVRGASPRFPWVETALAASSVLLVVGVVLGARFGKIVWGTVPIGDPRLLLAAVTATFAWWVATPLAIWARLRMEPRRRHRVLAATAFVIVLLFVAFYFAPSISAVH